MDSIDVAPREKVTFLCPNARRQFRLTPDITMRDGQGNPTGEMRLGKVIQFDAGRFTTDDPELIAWLLKNAVNDVTILMDPNELPAAPGGVQIVGGLSSASAAGKEPVPFRSELRCSVCGKAGTADGQPFKNARALAMHIQGAHLGRSEEETPEVAVGDPRRNP